MPADVQAERQRHGNEAGVLAGVEEYEELGRRFGDDGNSASGREAGSHEPPRQVDGVFAQLRIRQGGCGLSPAGEEVVAGLAARGVVEAVRQRLELARLQGKLGVRRYRKPQTSSPFFFSSRRPAGRTSQEKSRAVQIEPDKRKTRRVAEEGERRSERHRGRANRHIRPGTETEALRVLRIATARPSLRSMSKESVIATRPQLTIRYNMFQVSGCFVPRSQAVGFCENSDAWHMPALAGFRSANRSTRAMAYLDSSRPLASGHEIREVGTVRTHSPLRAKRNRR